MALDSWKWSHMFLDQRHILPWKKTELSCPSWPASGQTSWWNGRVPACDLVWLSCLLNLSVPALASIISKSQFTDSELPELFERLQATLKIPSHIEDLKIWFHFVLPPRWKKYLRRESPRGGITFPLPPKNFASKIWGFLLRFQWHQRPRFDGSYPEHRRATTTGTHEVRTKGQQD